MHCDKYGVMIFTLKHPVTAYGESVDALHTCHGVCTESLNSTVEIKECVFTGTINDSLEKQGSSNG